MAISNQKNAASEWLQPSSRPQTVEELINGVDRYNPSNLPILEDYLYSQVREGTYDSMSNLAILKLYQFNPTLVTPDVLIHLLLKALSYAPINGGVDYNLCMALVGDLEPFPTSAEELDEDSQVDESAFSLPTLIPFLSNLNNLLRTSQYAAFWSTLSSSSEPAAQILAENYLVEYPLFKSGLRVNIALVVAKSFSRIDSKVLSRWLDVSSEGEEFEEEVEGLGWSIEGEYVVVPKNKDNDVKGKVIKEKVDFSQLSKVIVAGGP